MNVHQIQGDPKGEVSVHGPQWGWGTFLDFEEGTVLFQLLVGPYGFSHCVLVTTTLIPAKDITG